MKLNYFTLSCILFSTFMIAQTRPPESENRMRQRAVKIHESVITIDTHNDIDINNFTDEINYTQNLDTQVNLPKMEKGGLDVSWLIVYTGQGNLDKEGYKKAYKNAMDKFDAIHRLVKKYAPEQIELALSATDVKRIHASGKKVAMIGVENAYSAGTDLSNIEKFYNKGARYMSLAHNGHSQFSDSNTGEDDGVWLHNGLSELGEQAVEEMNRLGIMIDISHPSKDANIQMIQMSKAPVIASHSSARALCDVSRNLDDELLQMIKNNGGVVQTVALDSYIDLDKFNANNDASQVLYQEIANELGVAYLTWDEVKNLSGVALEEAYDNASKILKIASTRKEEINAKYPMVNVRDFVNHIDYMVNKMGIDHVGISSDFDGGGGIEGWNDASETFNVTYELVRRGYSQEDIAKLWGLNLLRVMAQVEAVAKKIQTSK
ncbi:dipeptidase [Lutimonas vermicola]|uniref:Dipeptidase n=1 Tax=Lutimonas vermicola TaxID=414288 RepID=A0ABU9KX10_9FLAO